MNNDASKAKCHVKTCAAKTKTEGLTICRMDGCKNSVHLLCSGKLHGESSNGSVERVFCRIACRRAFHKAIAGFGETLTRGM